jgi:cell division protein FtsB
MTQTVQRRRIAKLRLEIKQLREQVECLAAHVRMQDEKIALVARHSLPVSTPRPYPPRYPYPRRAGA